MKAIQGTVSRYCIILSCCLTFWCGHSRVFAANPPTTISPGGTSSPGPTISTLTPTFSWNAATGATGYGLYIRDVTTGVLIYPNSSGTTTTPLTGTSLILPSGYLVAGHAYRWNMTSFVGSTESGVSGLLYFQEATPVNPPTIISPGNTTSPGTTISTLTPTFSWNAASGATGYGLYIRDVTTGVLIYPNSSGTTTTPLTGTSFGLPSGYLVAGHAYRWNMTSFVGSTESGVSSILYFQTATPVGPPTINSPGSATSPGTSISTLTPTFSWNAATGATGYGLYIRDVTTGVLIYPNSSGTTLTPLTGTSFNLPNGYLVSGHAYRWDMTSFDGSGSESGVSSLLYFQTATPVGPPTINSPGSATSPGTTIATLTPTFSWNAASGATGYGLYIRDVTTGVLIYPNSSGTTAIPLTGTSFGLPSGYLVAGHAYRWDMTSFDSGGVETGVSSLLYFQTANSVGPPTPLAPGTTTDTGYAVADLMPTFSWTGVAGATRYGLYISQAPYGSANIVYSNTTLTGTSFPIPSGQLIAGNKYRWNMTSFDSGGNESGVSATTLYFQTPGVVTGTGRIFGVDVSAFGQPGTIDWSQVKLATLNVAGTNYPITFALVRASKGKASTLNDCDFIDPDFLARAQAATNAGIVVGAYHVAGVTNINTGELYSADAEAMFFVSVATNYIGEGHLRPALDLEDHSCGSPKALGKVALSAWVDAFLSKMKELTGITPMIYCNSDYLSVLDPTLAQKYDLWIADPTSDPDSQAILTPWTTRLLQQYDWHGSVAGITNQVDLNVFHGSQQDFATQLTSVTSQPTPSVGFNASGNQIILTWPTTATGFSLQSATSLSSGAVWSSVASPVIVGGNYVVTNTTSAGVMFFRLIK